ncbi:hypothetical protein CONPUDRAFT_78436 [Coniophora puteana RWD-64-598 SS2]|uniref:Uncharacterized protein n=1 Tax=Coniophora puteana (strain RWD-64-598) TaxID=741705 RepID=R7SCL1_CONPW|nr:uncharacterized protein CONPUDRAFT_78436 [Coniophora puteana RWD-64-598 SS2]EIW73898.1 hypothetical protein CONPUDRAFT_78436 [Coniophora puteana RWD-64-598 SS2]
MTDNIFTFPSFAPAAIRTVYKSDTKSVQAALDFLDNRYASIVEVGRSVPVEQQNEFRERLKAEVVDLVTPRHVVAVVGSGINFDSPRFLKAMTGDTYLPAEKTGELGGDLWWLQPPWAPASKALVAEASDVEMEESAVEPPAKGAANAAGNSGTPSAVASRAASVQASGNGQGEKDTRTKETPEPTGSKAKGMAKDSGEGPPAVKEKVATKPKTKAKTKPADAPEDGEAEDMAPEDRGKKGKGKEKAATKEPEAPKAPKAAKAKAASAKRSKAATPEASEVEGGEEARAAKKQKGDQAPVAVGPIVAAFARAGAQEGKAGASSPNPTGPFADYRVLPRSNWPPGSSSPTKPVIPSAPSSTPGLTMSQFGSLAASIVKLAGTVSDLVDQMTALNKNMTGLQSEMVELKGSMQAHQLREAPRTGVLHDATQQTDTGVEPVSAIPGKLIQAQIYREPGARLPGKPYKIKFGLSNPYKASASAPAAGQEPVDIDMESGAGARARVEVVPTFTDLNESAPSSQA